MPLTDDELHEALATLEGWRASGDALHRGFRFPGFKAAMRFVNRVADEAVAARHHPEVCVSYDRVTISLTTHDEGGISAKDVALAHAIDAVIEDPPA
jgi:4a-hydroxytetrahydrobiopterin dehydratase